MVDFRQSQFANLVASNPFLWCTGIEDTFITAPFPKTGRILDEYELTDHYKQWSTDLDLMAELGVLGMWRHQRSTSTKHLAAN